MRKSIFLLLCLVGMASCTDHKDLYNPDVNPTPEKENPLGIEVPDDMDWSMISTITVRVDVDDEYLGKYYYVVEVYDNDPLFSENANLKASGVAKQGEPFVGSFEVGAGQKYLFVKRTDPRGRSIVGWLEVQKGVSSLSYNFNSSTAKSATSRAVEAKAVEMPTYSKVPEGAIEVKGCSTNDDWFEDGKNYCITKEYSGGIYHNGRGNCKLFVSGTWNIPSSNVGNWQGQIETGLEVIVLPGGKIETDRNLSFVGTSSLTIMKDAIFECGTLTLTNAGIIYNLGQMNVDNIDFQSTPLFYNNCGIKVTNQFYADAANVTINLSNGSIEAKNIVFNNATVNMLAASMVKASEEIDNMSNTKYYATGSSPSLVDAPTISCTSSVLYDGMLKVHSLNHSHGDAWWSPYTVSNGAHVTTDNVVAIETCGGASVTPDPGHEPSDPEFPLEVTTSDTYIYAMEDQWPSYGDYDMNDVVVQLKKKITRSHNDTYVKELTLEGSLLAVGANNPIAAAVQLEGITQDKLRTGSEYQIKNEKYSDDEYQIKDFTLMSADNHSERGQTYVTIPLFGKAQRLLGGNYVNVGRGAVVSDCPDMQIKIRFKENAIRPEDLSHEKINFFIIGGGVGNGRTEIHLPGYKQTDLGGVASGGVDNGKGFYVSTDNLSWGLTIPTSEWSWPAENENIRTVYPDFEKWLTSGGKQYRDWYKRKE